MEDAPLICSKNKRKVLVVDGHPIVRAGLVHLIDKESDLWVCDEAADACLAA